MKKNLKNDYKTKWLQWKRFIEIKFIEQKFSNTCTWLDISENVW